MSKAKRKTHVKRCQQQNGCRIFWDFLPRLKIIQAAEQTQPNSVPTHTQPHTHTHSNTHSQWHKLCQNRLALGNGKGLQRRISFFFGGGRSTSKTFVWQSVKPWPSPLYFYVFAQLDALLPPPLFPVQAIATLTPNERGSK